jgi:hypothetical protein
MFRSKRFAASLVLICAAVMAFGCGSSSTSPEPVNEAPIGPPLHVLARQYDGGDILVAWEPNSQANIVGTNLYRANQGSDNFVKLNPSPITIKVYLDDTVQYGNGYVYRVTSVNSGGNESVYRSVGIFNKFPKEPGLFPPPPPGDKDIGL